jgi:hypothetical protein
MGWLLNFNVSLLSYLYACILQMKTGTLARWWLQRVHSFWCALLGSRLHHQEIKITIIINLHHVPHPPLFHPHCQKDQNSAKGRRSFPPPLPVFSREKFEGVRQKWEKLDHQYVKQRSHDSLDDGYRSREAAEADYRLVYLLSAYHEHCHLTTFFVMKICKSSV